MTDFKREKVLPSVTEKVATECGSLFFTKAFQDEKLVEIRALIGKSGICPSCQLNNFSKVVSMYLQSPEPRYKIVKKFNKQFVEASCGQPFEWKEKKYLSCHHYICQEVVKELEKQIE